MRKSDSILDEIKAREIAVYEIRKFINVYYSDSETFDQNIFWWFCDTYHIVAGECMPIDSTINNLSYQYTGYQPSIQSVCGQFYRFESSDGKKYLLSHPTESHEAVVEDVFTYGIADIAIEFNHSFHSPSAIMVLFECNSVRELSYYIHAYLVCRSKPDVFPAERVEAWRKEMMAFMSERHLLTKMIIQKSLQKHELQNAVKYLR